MEPSPFFVDDPHGRFQAARSTSGSSSAARRGRSIELLSGGRSADHAFDSRNLKNQITGPAAVRYTRQTEQLSQENASISHQSVDMGHLRQVRRRKPPQTQLEVLSSPATWAVILFPWILLVVTVQLDYYINNAIPLQVVSNNNCPFPLRCVFANESIQISIKQQYYFTQFVDISIIPNSNFSGNWPKEVSSMSSSAAQQDINLNFSLVHVSLYSSNFQIHPFYEDNFLLAPSLCTSSEINDGCVPTEEFSEYIDLNVPTLNANDDLLRLNITCSGHGSMKALNSMNVYISYSTKEIALFKASIEGILFGVTIYRIYRSMSQTRKYVYRIDPECHDCVPMRHMLPEQVKYDPNL